MSGEALALGITFLIHVVGMCILFAALVGREEPGFWRSWWPRDDDGPGGGGGPDPGPAPGPPLPDADRPRARLREPGRLADSYPSPPRRPAREPRRSPQRERA